MGALATKEMAVMVVGALPTIISAFKSTSEGSRNVKEDKEIAEALATVQRHRDDIDQLMQNQAQLIRTFEGLTLLMTRLQNGGGGGGHNHITGAERTGVIRIEMYLPENPDERDEAIENFWRTLGSHAAARVAHNDQQRVLPIEPRDSSCKASSPHVRHLCCGICTNRYNTREHRPLLLPMCGHTFCKDCLRKANKENHRCPTCCRESNVDVDSHPTNYSLLDFMEEEEENDFKLKGKKVGLVSETLHSTFEDDLSRALEISLRDANENNDRLLAERLQEEENRIMHFSHHGDLALKGRNVEHDMERDDLEGSERECPEDKHRLPESETYWGRLGSGQFLNDTFSAKTVSDDEDDDCHAIYKSPNTQNYNDACSKLDDDKICSDSDDDDCFNSRPWPVDNGHVTDTNRLQREASSVLFQREERKVEDNSLLETDNSGSLRLIDVERDAILDRAQRSYELDKAERRKRKALKEQEELDLAIALSMSLSEQKGQDS